MTEQRFLLCFLGNLEGSEISDSSLLQKTGDTKRGMDTRWTIQFLYQGTRKSTDRAVAMGQGKFGKVDRVEINCGGPRLWSRNRNRSDLTSILRFLDRSDRIEFKPGGGARE